MTIYNLGSINIDHVYAVDHFVRPGETMTSRGLASHAGGKGFNQSVALARAGAQVVHIGAIGADGRALLAALERDGVDVSAITVEAETPTGHAIIQVDPQGRNCIIVAPGANATLTPDAVRAALAAAKPGDLLLAQNETSAIAEAIRDAKARGLRVALNPAPMDGRVETQPLELVDTLVVNEIESVQLLDLHGVAAPGSPTAALEALRRLHPHAQIIMTLGEDGAIAADTDGAVSQVPAFRVQAVDTTAAGDTFTGFFLASQARGVTTTEALRLASAAAAIAVTRHGAAPSVPTINEVEAWLAAQNDERTDGNNGI
ncbi:MAG: ribokinase [Kiritimatiellia bacterium]|jgi:ribokinase